MVRFGRSTIELPGHVLKAKGPSLARVLHHTPFRWLLFEVQRTRAPLCACVHWHAPCIHQSCLAGRVGTFCCDASSCGMRTRVWSKPGPRQRQQLFASRQWRFGYYRSAKRLASSVTYKKPILVTPPGSKSACGTVAQLPVCVLSALNGRCHRKSMETMLFRTSGPDV